MSENLKPDNSFNVPDGYLIEIHGPLRLESEGRTRLYDIDSDGAGSITAYKVSEGTNPFLNVGHLEYVGSFALYAKEDKTLLEYIQEIRKGIEELISSSQPD